VTDAPSVDGSSRRAVAVRRAARTVPPRGSGRLARVRRIGIGIGIGTLLLGGCLGDPSSAPNLDDGGSTRGASEGTSRPGSVEGSSSSASPTTGPVGGSDEGRPPSETGEPGCGVDCGPVLRVATWNILRVDEPGTPQFDALVDIVRRLDADVLCVQEVGEGEESRLQALVDAGGYLDGLLAPFSGPDGSGIANACMSRTAVADAAYLWSNWISEDDSARDITRPFVRLRLQVPGTERYVSIVTAHLKAGGDDVDRFRRMVESVRLSQVARDESETYPGNAIVIMGDLNEGENPSPDVFDTLPAGLPSFYNLGSDIALPLDYDPPGPLLDAGLQRVDPDYDQTFIPSGSRLDYVYVGAADIVDAEVYDACRDAPGEGIPKLGDPLDCGLSELASDHRPVVVDLRLR